MQVSSRVVIPVGTTIWDAIRVIIQATLTMEDGDKEATCATLGISMKDLESKLESYRAADAQELTLKEVERNKVRKRMVKHSHFPIPKEFIL